MSKRVLQFFSKKITKTVGKQSKYAPRRPLNMGWGRGITLPMHEVCFIRLGISIGKVVGCSFSALPGPNEHIGSRGRFYGTKRDVKMAFNMYIQCGKAIMWASNKYKAHLITKGCPEDILSGILAKYRNKLVERLASIHYGMYIKRYNNPGLDHMSITMSRHSLSSINMTHALMAERDAK